MNKLTVLLVALLSTILCGCGGSGPSNTAANSKLTGSISLTIDWPKPARTLDPSVDTIQLTVTNASAVVIDTVTVKRAAGASSATISLTEPLEQIRLDAIAFNSANPSVILDQGGYPSTLGTYFQLTPGSPANVPLTLYSVAIKNITQVNVLGVGSTPLFIGQTLQLTAVGVEPNGSTIPLPSAELTWSSQVPSDATVGAQSGLVTGLAANTITIYVTDSVSGKSGQAILTIVDPSTYGPSTCNINISFVYQPDNSNSPESGSITGSFTLPGIYDGSYNATSLNVVYTDATGSYPCTSAGYFTLMGGPNGPSRVGVSFVDGSGTLQIAEGNVSDLLRHGATVSFTSWNITDGNNGVPDRVVSFSGSVTSN